MGDDSTNRKKPCVTTNHDAIHTHYTPHYLATTCEKNTRIPTHTIAKIKMVLVLSLLVVFTLLVACCVCVCA